MATVKDLTAYLDRNEVEYTWLVHQPAAVASELAATISVPECCMAQTLIVQADQHFWMVVFSADREVNIEALAKLLEAKILREADETDMMFFFPECKVSPLPPFGNLYGFPVIADKGLEDCGRILFGACSPSESIFMRWQDYQRLVRPIVAEFTHSRAVSESAEVLHSRS
ncbi:MAG: YbaK/EbsC family protein [Ignavibacteria bacterium]|nr:YbaK/EbsC family protein [Ignavibacteria bacterium]